MKATASPKDRRLQVVLKPRILTSGSAAVHQVFSNSPNVWHWVALFWLACPLVTHPLLAQSLRLSAATASRGEEIAIEISSDSPAGNEPLALQWEISIPAEMRLLDCGMPDATGADGLGKILKCAPIGKGAGDVTSRCIVAGGRKPIPNGPVALLRLRISREAHPGSAHIRIAQATAVSHDLTQINLGSAETTVTIRK